MTTTTAPRLQPLICDLLIYNAYLVTVNSGREIYVDGAVAVKGRRIVAVGRSADVRAAWRGMQELDCDGAVVHPGFVETHMHITLHGARNAINEPVLWDEQQKFYADYWSLINDDDEYAGSRLAILEMVKYGATAFMDSGSTHSPDAVASAAESVGIRARVGDPFLWDVGGFGGTGPEAPQVDRAPASIDRALSLLGGELKRNSDPTDLVQGHVALMGMATASDELTLAAKQLAREHGVTFNQHQTYGHVDYGDDVARLGKAPLVHWAELGILDPGTTFAHVNIVSDEELSSAAGTGFTVSWNPISSQMYGVGAGSNGRHFELGRRGVNLALGSDSPNYTGRYDTGAMAFQAILSARDQARDPAVINAENGLEMATINGARALSADHLFGSIETGKLADFVIRRRDTLETTPVTNRIQNLIYSSRSTGIDTVVCNGVIVVHDGVSTQVDEEEVRRQAQVSSSGLLRRIDYSPKPVWPEIG